MPFFGGINIHKLETKRDIPGLIKALCHKNITVRQAAASALERIDRHWETTEAAKGMVPFLIIALKENDPGIRQGAADALRRMPDVRAVEPLIHALSDNDLYVRYNVVLALGGTKDTRAVQPLITALADGPEKITCMAAQILGWIGDVRAIEPLLTALKENKKPEVQKTIIKAINEIGDARAVDPLLNAVKMIEDQEVQKEISKALCKIGLPAVDPLIAVLIDQNRLIRNFAADALIRIDGPEVRQKLLDLVQAGATNESIFYILDKLGWRPQENELGNKLNVLMAYLLRDKWDRGSVDDAKEILDSLGAVGDSKAVHHLLRVAAGGPDIYMTSSTLPYHALYVLQNMGPSIIPILQSALQDPQVTGKSVAIRLLSEFDGDKSKDLFIRILQAENSDNNCLNAAAVALGKIKCVEAVPLLVKVLEQERGGDYKWVQRAVIIALGDIADNQAVGSLVKLLSIETDRDLLEEIIPALGRIGSPDAFNPLVEFYEKVIANNIRFIADPGRAESAWITSLLATEGSGSEERLISLLDKANCGRLAVACLSTSGDAHAIPALLRYIQKRSQEDMKEAGGIPAGRPEDPIHVRPSAIIHGAGPALICLYKILCQNVKSVSIETLEQVVNLGPVVASVHYLNMDDFGGDDDYRVLLTDEITSLARSELESRAQCGSGS